MELLNNLEKLGLNQKEAKVFLAILELGESQISAIAKKSQVKRPTAYYIIEELEKRGYINKIIKGKRFFYKTTHPRNFLNDLDKQKKAFESILPQLEILFYRQNTQPKIKFFEGKNGLKQIYEEMLSTPKNIYTIFSFDDFLKVFNDSDNKYFFEILRKNGGRLHDLVIQTTLAKQSVKQEKYRQGVAKIKFLPEDLIIKTDFLVRDNKLAIISFDSLIGLIIDDENVATSQKNLFKYLWGTIK